MMSKKNYERKLREEQEAAAYVFQDFITTFQDSAAPANKVFLRSAVLNSENDEIELEKSQLYNPQPIVLKQQRSDSIKNALECARILKENKIERPKNKQDKPKSNLELLKEEIKLRHAERDEREKYRETITSQHVNYFDGGDPTSTNLFVANLNCKVTENDLMLLFGAFGALASVKIMWPRGEERRNSNCGFVAFMSRKDAERALNQLKYRDDMRVGWGKSVELPQHPIYIPAELLKLYLPPPTTGLPFNAQPLNPNYDLKHNNNDELIELLGKSVVKVTIPLNKKVLATVNRMVEFVVREGPMFEAYIMNKEINNSDFNFLFDYRCPVHIYYRWKLFSVLNGDGIRTWSMKPFRMYKGGAIWLPPLAPNFQNGMPEELISTDTKWSKALLSKGQCNRLVQTIRNLSLTRCKIAEAMVFCLNHSDALNDVIDVIMDSLRNYETGPLKKLARLYLLSDVLYNARMKKVQFSIDSDNLLAVFKSLRYSFKGLKYPLDKENFELRITKILRYWDVCQLVPVGLIHKLEYTFVNSSNDFVDDDNSSTDEPLDGASLIKRLKNNTHCIATPRTEKKDQKAKDTTAHEFFVPSKWDTVDPEEVEAQAMSSNRLYHMEMERKIKSTEKLDLPASKWDSEDENSDGDKKFYKKSGKKGRRSKGM